MDFPPGMPNTGQTVPACPADMIRDVFLHNGGRLPAQQVENMIGRHTFTYGADVVTAWERLQENEYVERDGDDWIWPMQMA